MILNNITITQINGSRTAATTEAITVLPRLSVATAIAALTARIAAGAAIFLLSSLSAPLVLCLKIAGIWPVLYTMCRYICSLLYIISVFIQPIGTLYIHYKVG